MSKVYEVHPTSNDTVFQCVLTTYTNGRVSATKHVAYGSYETMDELAMIENSYRQEAELY